MSSYPVAYRKGSRTYGNAPRAGAKAFKLPPPYQPPTKPPASNDNFPKPVNDNSKKVARNLARLSKAGKLIARRLPYIGYALTALELWRLLNQNNTLGLGRVNLPNGMILQTDCGASPPSHYNYIAGGSGPWTSDICFSSSLDTSARPLGQPIPFNVGKIRLQKYVGQAAVVQERYAASQYWYRPSTSFPNQGHVLARHAYRWPQRAPGKNVVIDPMNLPIKWPMPYPDPVPAPLAPHRLDHPFIRQTGNHAVPKPRFVVRRPPPPGDKEVKLAARGGVLRTFLALQKISHGTTEALDALDAFHDALPKEYRAKGRYVEGLGWRKAPPQEKAKAIWDNIEHMDWEQAAINLAKNHAIDAVMGRANAGADRALNNSPIGRINRGFAF